MIPVRRWRHPMRPLAMPLCLMLALAGWPAISGAAASRPAAQVVEEVLITTRDAILGQAEALTADAEAAEKLMRETLVPRIDTRATARFVLGQKWQQANEEQRDRFHAAFTRHVNATYALLLHRFADEVVNALKRVKLRTEIVREGEQTALVRAFFRLDDGPERQARIHLHARNGEWLLFDAEYAGFSLLRIWQAEIQGRLRDQTLPALIEALKQRHTEQPPLASGRPPSGEGDSPHHSSTQ